MSTMESDFSSFLLERRANKSVIILDGATGDEIKKRKPDMVADEAWSGITQIKEGGGDVVVGDIHRDYVERGAEIVIANTFASNRHVLGAEELGHLTEEANKVGAQIALNIAREAKHKVWVAGSVSNHPPRSLDVLTRIRSGELPAGTKVSAAVAWPNPEDERANYVEQAGYLKAAGVDCIALEMLTTVEHARIVCSAIAETKLPVMLGLTLRLVAEDGIMVLRDDHSDTPVEEVIPQLLESCPNIVCISTMHGPVDEVKPGLEAIRKAWDGPLGAYPNNVFAASRFDRSAAGGVSTDALVEAAQDWIRSYDIDFVGGCCGFGPTHIAALNVADLQICKPCKT